MVSDRYTPKKFNNPHIKIVGVERDKHFFIPNDNEIEILPKDLIYIFGDEDKIKTICDELELDTTDDIKNCVVFGGEALGISIAKELLDSGKAVKLVEKNLKYCEMADELLQGKVSIINSKYSSHEIFEEEALDNADIFISATNNDEYNIIKSLEAKEVGIKKVVAINNEMEYYNLMHSLGIVVVRGPKMSAYNTIMEEISSTGVVLQKSYCGAKALVFMRKIFPNSKLIDKKAKHFKIKKSSFFYIRDGVINTFEQKIVLKEEDILVVFCTTKESSKVEQWIYGL